MGRGKRVFLLLVMLLVFLTRVGYCEVPVTSPFGWRVHPITGKYKFHSGVDLGYDYGDDVLAVMPGQVVYCYWWGGYGNCVILAHANGDHTLYGHMSEILVTQGQVVTEGQVLGKVGSTGMSTGPHLHLEWWHNGVYTDPLTLSHAQKVQNYEFYASVPQYQPPVRNDAPVVPERPRLPASQGDLKIPDNQMDQALAQLNEVFEYKEKETPDSLFFDI